MAKTKNKKIDLIYIWDKYFLFIVLALSVLLLLAVYAIFFHQKISTLIDQNKQLKSINQNIVDANSQLAELKVKLSEAPKITEDDARIISYALPKSFDQTNFIKEVNSIAKEKGFTISKIEFTTPTAKSTSTTYAPKRMEINMTVKGPGYDVFRRFLELMEKSIMYLDINSIVFTPDNDDFNLKISSYYYP